MHRRSAHDALPVSSPGRTSPWQRGSSAWTSAYRKIMAAAMPGRCGHGPRCGRGAALTAFKVPREGRGAPLALSQDSAGGQALAALARLDDSRFQAYTVFVRSAASEPARQALEALMTTKFKDTFVDRLLAEGEAKGKAEGEARMILRVLSARGLQVPAEIRRRALSLRRNPPPGSWGGRGAPAA